MTSIDPRITELERELRDAKRQIVHWRKNSEEQVRRKHLTHGTQWREAADEFLRECAPLVFSKDETVFGVKPRVKP